MNFIVIIIGFMMKNYYWNTNTALLSFTWIFLQVHCQTLDSPPTVWLPERHWNIADTDAVGTKITQVYGSDSGGKTLTYSLEPITYAGSSGTPKKLPFRIDPVTAAVYLNETLKGRVGENFYLYVTVSNGVVPAKSEVWVTVVNGSAPAQSHSPKIFFPGSQGGYLNIPGFNGRPPTNVLNNPPSNIANNPPPRYPYFQQKTYPTVTSEEPVVEKANTSLSTHLTPVTNKKTTKTNSSKMTSTTTTEEPDDISTEKKTPITHIDTNKILVGEQTSKSVYNYTETLVPILSVCGVFLIVGIIALLFRKKIYLSKAKSSKDEKAKEQSGGIVLQDDPTLAMQAWRGPRAFSNRYEPWERDSNHQQAVQQISGTIKNADRWEFPRHRLKFFNILGEGAFGQVWKCEALDMEGKDGLSVVAVKTLKENANEKERSDLASELQVMKMLEPHPNVVKLLGCCTDKEPIFLIMEYITKGKLQSYLRNSRAERYYNNMHGQSKSLTSRDLTSFVYQVARGMEFLSSNGIIHRDLAARNILITEEHTCKVADFGFARDVIASHVYERKSEGRLPIRWMAPESLYDNIFSVKSDVWSFGILIWEVVTLGSTPYPGLSAAEVMKKVRDGYRLDKPEHCRRELFNIMYYCWDKDPKERPSFPECIELLEKLLMTETDYIELERFPDHSYYNMMSLSGEKL